MSTPFLVNFAEALVGRLLASGDLQLQPGASPELLIGELAEKLNVPAAHRSLVSSVVEAFVASPLVDELFCDDEQLKEHISDLGLVR